MLNFLGITLQSGTCFVESNLRITHSYNAHVVLLKCPTLLQQFFFIITSLYYQSLSQILDIHNIKISGDSTQSTQNVLTPSSSVIVTHFTLYVISDSHGMTFLNTSGFGMPSGRLRGHSRDLELPPSSIIVFCSCLNQFQCSATYHTQ